MSQYPVHECGRVDESGRAVAPAMVTCGACGRSWCERCDPAPSALCHFCHGRGSSIAPIPPRQRRALGVFLPPGTRGAGRGTMRPAETVRGGAS